MGKKIREQKDQEGGMARVEIDSIERAVQNLKKKITKSDQQLPAWVQSKITRAADYVNSASQYLMSGEELDEGAPAPFNHQIVKPDPNRNRLAKFTDEQLSANPNNKKAQEELARRRAQQQAEQQRGIQPAIDPKILNAATRKQNQTESLSLADKILEEMGCGCDKMKSHKTPEQIAKKHNVPVKEVLKQLKAGTKVEFEHTNSKKEAEAIALQHLNERPDYYSRLKKVEAANENVTITDMFGNPTYEFIDLIKPDAIISEEEKKKNGNLHKWFSDSKSKDGKPGWVNVVTGGTCASDEPGEGIPKCVSSKKRASMSKKERKSAARRKKVADPGQQSKSGAAKPTYVATDLQEVKDKPGKGSGEKDACYRKVRSRYKVWPSAYASGALVKCRKVGADNWGTTSEACWDGYKQKGMKKKKNRMVPNCVPVNEFLSPVQQFQNVPPATNRALEIDRKIQKLNLDKQKQSQKIIQQQRRGNLPYSGATGLPTMEEEVIPTKNGQVMFVTVLWRGKYLGIQMFFPQTRIPNRGDVQDAVSKVYPDARLVTYKIGNLKQDIPLIQIQNSPSKNYKLNSGIIGEESEKSKMPCNKPKAEPHGSGETGKSHVVKACSGGKQKLIRFGQLGVKGSPKKEGESKEYADRRRRFKKRHSKNIKKGPMSAAYWANKVKW